MTAVPEMIERVARALCLYDRGKDDDWDAQVYLESARAAIAAMGEMKPLFHHQGELVSEVRGSPADLWREFIQSALGNPQVAE